MYGAVAVLVETRDDFTLDNFRRVALEGEGVTIGSRARQAMESAREAFVRLLESDREQFIYGTTSESGAGAKIPVPPERQREHARQSGASPARGFGPDYLEERVVRGMVFARLVNLVSGSAKVRPVVAERVAAVLEGPMPPMPVDGQAGAGEILPLFQLLAGVPRDDLEEGEPMALVNGSPCAAALVADAALHARHRLSHAEAVFALSVEAFGAPLEAYDAALDDLWADDDEAAALQALRRLLAGADTSDRLFHQAPVSYRIAGRVLGQARRAVGDAEKAARVSLRSVTDNPIYVLPDAAHPLGRALSNGGYHNAMATPALDALSVAWAELAFLAERQATALNTPATSGIPVHGGALYGWVMSGFVEEARRAAGPTLTPAAVNDPQNDVATATFLAYRDERRAAGCLEHALAGLAIVASEALSASGRRVAPPLAGLLAGVRSVFPTGAEAPGRDRLVDADRLAAVFGRAALSGDLDFTAATGT